MRILAQAFAANRSYTQKIANQLLSAQTAAQTARANLEFALAVEASKPRRRQNFNSATIVQAHRIAASTLATVHQLESIQQGVNRAS